MTQVKPYLEHVASILYASTPTRPDIIYHTSMLCRFMHHDPSVDCYLRAKELLNYFYSTKDTALVLGGENIFVPHLDTLRDAGAKEINPNDFAQCIAGNHSFYFHSDTHPGRPTTPTFICALRYVCQRSRRLELAPSQSRRSSCQAKTADGCVAAKRNTFLRNLLGHSLDIIETKLNGGATVLLMEYFAAVEQADHAGASKKTEHYKRWEHHIRECQLDGAIKTHFIPRATKWPTASPRFSTRPRSSSCAST
eukprot:1110300-Pleurochrysis_carterae.AAC.2